MTTSESEARWSCGCVEHLERCGGDSCKRSRVRATYDAGTDPVPRLEPTTGRVEDSAREREWRSTVDLAGPPDEPNPRESAIYERGGFVPRDIATEQRGAWTEPTMGHTERVMTMAERWGQDGLGTPPPTPAAMLGEALEHIRKAREIVASLCRGEDVLAERTDNDLEEATQRVEGLKREAEARACGPDGMTCATCGHEFPTTSARDAHQATAHAKCGLCGGEIGPDITGRPMCYRCGPEEMKPHDA